MAYWWLISPLLILAALHYVTVGRAIGIFTMDGIFVLTQTVMSVGTLAILDPSSDADRLYAMVMFAAPASYILVSVLLFQVNMAKHNFVRDNSSKHHLVNPQRVIEIYRPTFAIGALAVLAGAITIAYFQAVGYNAFFVGIQGLASGTNVDITTLRLDSYNESRYLFPGYVNQFKNTILPALALVISLYLFQSRHQLRHIITIPLVIMSIFGLLGTGQRGAFIQFTLALFTFLYHYNRSRFRRRAIVGMSLAGPLLFLATVILGRSSSLLGTDSGIFSKVSTIAREVLKRFFYDNQWSGQMVFRYTYVRPVQNGKEWLDGVLGVLPGNSGSSLPRQVFESLYGTDRGTAPPSLWGSVFYNFGWMGILILPIVMAVFYQTITLRSVLRAKINTLELVGMSGTFVVLGNWVAGGPEYLLNAGGITFAVLWWLGRRSNRSSRVPVAANEPIETRTPSPEFARIHRTSY